MKKSLFIVLVLALLFPQIVPAGGATTARNPEPQSVTLYATNKYPNDRSRSFFSFKTGSWVRESVPWDLNYGSLYVGDDFDWFSVSTSQGTRSIIKDLGALKWSDSFRVPIVEPFPKLKPGEVRKVTIDASGADGAPGAPGVRGADADGRVRNRTDDVDTAASEKARTEKRRSGVPQVDSIFAKAVVGHIYVIHVVDDESDYYALFRVEAMEKGDNCTISWKRIKSPKK